MSICQHHDLDGAGLTDRMHNLFLSSKSSCPKDLGRLLGESLADRVLKPQTKTIAALKRWPGLCARLLTRYDVKCWFFMTLPVNLLDDIILLTAYALHCGTRDGWATVAGNGQLLAMIGSQAYADWLGNLRSVTPPNTRPGRPGVPFQFRSTENKVDLQAALRNFLWTGTGPYRGPQESVLFPTSFGFEKTTLCSKTELEVWRARVSTPDEVLEVVPDGTEVITLSDSDSDSSEDS